KRVFLVILFTSFSGSLVSRIPGAVHSRQVEWHGRWLDAESWKCVFTAALKQQDVVPNLAGNGFVVIGQSTSRMRVSEFAELLELIQAFGTERGVKWSDEARLALEWKARWGDRAA
ncbi:recombination protein NinB, partial [Escherichia coli]|nr:recombination protein NinB [Escherichia coli]